MNKGDYYKVVDKATKEIICAGPISFIKNTANMVMQYLFKSLAMKFDFSLTR